MGHVCPAEHSNFCGRGFQCWNFRERGATALDERAFRQRRPDASPQHPGWQRSAVSQMLPFGALCRVTRGSSFYAGKAKALVPRGRRAATQPEVMKTLSPVAKSISWIASAGRDWFFEINRCASRLCQRCAEMPIVCWHPVASSSPFRFLCSWRPQVETSARVRRGECVVRCPQCARYSHARATRCELSNRLGLSGISKSAISGPSHPRFLVPLAGTSSLTIPGRIFRHSPSDWRAETIVVKEATPSRACRRFVESVSAVVRPVTDHEGLYKCCECVSPEEAASLTGGRGPDRDESAFHKVSTVSLLQKFTFLVGGGFYLRRGSGVRRNRERWLHQVGRQQVGEEPAIWSGALPCP